MSQENTFQRIRPGPRFSAWHRSASSKGVPTVKRLTTKTLQRYVGGQLEIRNFVRITADSYSYRGEIATIVVENNTLYVKFAWVAKQVELATLTLPGRWVKCDPIGFAVDLNIYRANRYGNGIISLDSRAIGEIILFYPPNDRNKLDPSIVEGLELPLQESSATTE